MPSFDVTDFAEGTLDSKLTTGTTTGVTITAVEENDGYVTWPPGRHEVYIVERSRRKRKVEKLIVASASQSGATVTLGTLTRNTSRTDGSDTTGSAATQTFSAGSDVYIGVGGSVVEQAAYIDKANTFTGSQTISSTNKLILNDSATYLKDDGTDLLFKDSQNSETSLSTLAATGGSDEKTGVDSAATAGYLGAANNDGVLRTDSTMTYTDGGDYVTLGTVNPMIVATGGTGLQTATAYAPLCGGTTATGAFQSIASVGTANQVLTSNGAGALPSFQDLSQDFSTTSTEIAALTDQGKSTASEDSVKSNTITANSMAAGDRYIIEGNGKLALASSDSMNFLVKIGSTEVTRVTVINGTAAARNGQFRFYCEIVCRTIGGSGTIIARSDILQTNTTDFGDSYQADSNSAEDTVDTTGSLAWELLVLAGSSNADNVVDFYELSFTKITT